MKTSYVSDKNKKIIHTEDSFWKNSLARFNSAGLNYESYNPQKALSYYALSIYVKKLLPLKASIAEFGCGSGLLLCYLYKEGFNVYGYDRSSYAIKYAKVLQENKNIKYPLKKLDIFKLKTHRLYDAVISSGMIEHFNKDIQVKLVKMMKQVSRSYIFILYPNVGSSIYKRFLKKQKILYPLEETIDAMKIRF